MTYDDVNTFIAGLEAAGFQRVGATNNAVWGSPFMLYDFYQWARFKMNSMHIGRLKDLEQDIASLGSAFQLRAKDGGRGGILGTPPGQENRWSMWLNDSFILGGIHGHKDFVVRTNPRDDLKKFRAGEKIPDYVFKDPEQVFYVTQRELIGVKTAGYDGQGDKLTCKRPDLADNMTFESYRVTVKEEAIKELGRVG